MEIAEPDCIFELTKWGFDSSPGKIQLFKALGWKLITRKICNKTFICPFWELKSGYSKRKRIGFFRSIFEKIKGSICINIAAVSISAVNTGRIAYYKGDINRNVEALLLWKGIFPTSPFWWMSFVRKRKNCPLLMTWATVSDIELFWNSQKRDDGPQLYRMLWIHPYCEPAAGARPYRYVYEGHKRHWCVYYIHLLQNYQVTYSTQAVNTCHDWKKLQ